jgi:hypothetical protein
MIRALVVCLVSAAAAITAAQVPIPDTTAAIWSELGSESASNGGVSQDSRGLLVGPVLGMSPGDGAIYAAYPSTANGGSNAEIYVKRWNGVSWVEAGVGGASGAGISNSPGLDSQTPQIAVRPSDGHVFVVWREYNPTTNASDIFASEFNGVSWQSLGSVSDVAAGVDANISAALEPQIVLSSVFSTSEMPVVAWQALVRVGQARPIMVKRWTGVAWVEMGSGSASVYQIPTTVRINGTTGLWEYADYVNARGINADDGLLDTRLEPLGDPPSPSIVNTLGNYHFSSSTPRLVRNTFGRPAIVFNNGDTRDGRAQYPYRIHVRSFTGDNAQPAYRAWEEVGRIAAGQPTPGFTASTGESFVATWAETGNDGLYVGSAMGTPTRFRVLQFVGQSWAPVISDLGTGQPLHQASLVKDSTGRLILARVGRAGTVDSIYVSASGTDSSGLPAWVDVGLGSATGLGVSNNGNGSFLPDVIVDSRNGTNYYIVGWLDNAGILPTQAYVRSTHPVQTTGPQPPGPPTNLTASATGSTVTLSWSAPAVTSPLMERMTFGPPATYIIEAGSATGAANLANFSTGNLATSMSASGVANGTYFVRVRAANAVGVSGPSNEVPLTVGQALTPPGPPGNLVAAATGSTVTLSWAAPASGGAPTTYVVEAGNATGLANLAAFPTGNLATVLSAPGVANGTYYVRVRAGNAAGISSPSNEAQVTVGTPVLAPSAPGGLTFTRSGSTVTLNWLAPTGGGAPASYIVEAGSGPGMTNIASVSSGSPATTLTAAAVPNGTYYVRVRASNAGGVSGASNEVTIVVGS